MFKLALVQGEPRLKLTVAQNLNISLPPFSRKILWAKSYSVRYISLVCLKSFLPENSWPFLEQGFTILVLNLQQHVKELVHGEAVALQQGGRRQRLQIRKSHQQAVENYFLYLTGSTWANCPLLPLQKWTVLVERFRWWFTEAVGWRAIKGWAGCRHEAQGLWFGPCPWAGHPTYRVKQAVQQTPWFMHHNAKKEAGPRQQADISHLTLLTDTICKQPNCWAR